MKKMLALLGVVSITASSLVVVGFEYSNLVKSSLEAKIRNYVNISSLLARGTILSQKSVDDQNNSTDGKDFSLNYSSKYLYSRNMGEFFDQSQFKDGTNQTILSYLGSMFNLPADSNFVYTVKDDDFVKASSTLALQDDVNTGKTGENSTMTTLSLVAGLVSIIFGQDFSADTSASLLENTLIAGESPIRSLIENGTLQTLQSILFDQDHDDQTKNISLFKKISNSFSEQDLVEYATSNSKNLTDLVFDEVFKYRQIEFWQGLGEILYSGTRSNDTTAEIDEWMQEIEDAGVGNYAEKALPSSGDKSDIKIEFNKVLIDGIVKVLRYVRTLMLYIQSFSETALPVSEIKDDNHLFSTTEINGIFIANKLKTEKYINLDHVVDQTNENSSGIIQWTLDANNNYHQVINFQDFVQFFQSLLTVDLKNDPHGYRLERALSILLELPLKSSDPGADSRDSDVSNPVYDLILEPLLIQLIKKNVDGIPGVAIAGILPSLTPAIRGVLTYNNSFWIDTPGASTTQSNMLKVLSFIKSFASYLPGNNMKAFFEELIYTIQKEQNANLPLTQQVYGQPFKALFDGNLLPSIFQILINNGNPISSKIQNVLKNLITLFGTKLSDVLASFGLDLDSLPIFLYGIKDYSIIEIIDTFGDQFQVNLEKTLKENQDYIFNLGAFDKVMTSLNQTVTIKFVDDKIPEIIQEAGVIDSEGNVNILNAILIAFGYSDRIQDLTVNYGTNSEKWTANEEVKKYTFLLGNRRDQDSLNFEFANGSIFDAVSQIYGHNNVDEPLIIQQKDTATLKQLIESAVKLVVWFNNFSIPLYVEDIFTPYFDSKHWKTQLKSYKNVANASDAASINYSLFYTNPDTGQTHEYEVKLVRSSHDGNNNDWNKMGTWKVASINLI